MTVTILIGDALEQLKTLPDNHFDCVMTSPPYWGLRDYDTGSWEGGNDADCDHVWWAAGQGSLPDSTNQPKVYKDRCKRCGARRVDKQLGLESTLAKHIKVMVEVFREVRRVLKPSGTLWLNYGDCYATEPNGRAASKTKTESGDDRTFRDKPFSTVQGKLKPKDLCMVPNRLAIALQDDGWWVRSEIVWGKPNGMPDSSGRFRPATAHEKIFLLTKTDKVDFYVARDTGEVSKNPDLSELCIAVTTGKEIKRWIGLGHYYNAAAVRLPQSPTSWRRLRQNTDAQKGSSRAVGKTNGPMKAVGGKPEKQRGHRRRHDGFNERWDQMSRQEQQENGRLLRNYEPPPLPVWPIATASFKEAHFATFPPELAQRCLVAGCDPSSRVLDPFGGSGTTAIVADFLGHDCTLIELNPKYAALAAQRIGRERPYERVAGFDEEVPIGLQPEAAE